MPPIATLELLSHGIGTATFRVHDADKKDTNEYSKWLAVWGYDKDGVARTAAYKGIRWGETTADDCEETILLNLDEDFPVVSYSAFVWMFPNSASPRSNIVDWEV